jgi:transcriptional regulator GlxA family with amidase domain
MKTFKKALIVSLSVLIVTGSFFAFLLQPVFALGKQTPYTGNKKFEWKKPQYDATKRTVFIIADNKMTEMFDMLAPFYLFNATGQLNVCIVSKEKAPVQIKKDLFILPQLTFKEVDSMSLVPDVIVIPALSSRDENQDPVIISFIKNHNAPFTRILAVCDGATTAAATGLFDGKPMTAHASDFKHVTSHFSKPLWIKNVSVAHSGNLYSTGGVSNAVEGALMVINDMFGKDLMQAVAENVRYPHQEIVTDHESIAIGFGNIMTIVNKVAFHRGHELGLLLQDGMNEFEFVSVLDTYQRTFPKSFDCFTLADSVVHTKYGLTVFHTGNNVPKKLDEMHVFRPVNKATLKSLYGNSTIVSYDQGNQYPIDVCLQRIDEQFGSKFKKAVKVTLDYN